MSHYDAVVIGAGPAGSSTALLLARAGWSVAIVEKAEFPRHKVCGEFISAPTLALLAQMGLENVLEGAGAEVKEVAVYAGERIVAAAMPTAAGPFGGGRAVGRDRLDTRLLDHARCAGAALYQPWRVQSCRRDRARWLCTLSTGTSPERAEVTSRVVIAAHGSWDTAGLLPRTRSGSDWIAFKTHFERADLPPGCMPLIAFPGGYGGLVHTDRDRVTFSCCIRRDALVRCRSQRPHASAGEAVLDHVVSHCRGARQALRSATPADAWLAGGPLRPGIRRLSAEGYFAVGNALGEAHPIIAEGISMAIQSAWLLVKTLGSHAPEARMNALAQQYEAAYRSEFAARIDVAAIFAVMAMQPRFAAAVAAMLSAAPALLGLGARLAGKTAALSTSDSSRQVISGRVA